MRAGRASVASHMSRALLYVTGASRGIGRALVESCPWPDARIVGVSRRAPERPPGISPYEHLTADLSDAKGWAALDAALARDLAGFAGERAALVHAAGTLTPIGFAGEVDPDAYARNVLLNSAAPQIVGDAFLRHAARTRARCDLVFIGSGAARHAYEGWSSYGAGKAACDQWTRTVGAEQARRGGRVRVLCVAPGVVETAMQAEIRATPDAAFPERARFEALFEEGALRRPADVAGDLWRLLEGDFENGAVLDLRDLAAAAR